TAAATSSNTDPARDNNATQNYTEYSYDLSAKGAKATTGECGLQIVTYSASTKNYAIGKVVITGTLSGTISAVVTYTIDANVNDATMGVVDIASAVINEGDGHTIEATANTGYEFVNWTKASDASWTSTTNPLVLSDITADETYTANFVKLNMITFAKGDAEQGTAPGVVYLPNGTTSYTIPANKKLYSAGKTLTKWNNGTTDYAIGATITGISSDITLTAQFEDNTIDLNGLTQESTVAMPFWQSEGAPVLAAEGNSTILVAQAAVGSKFVDILVSIDATSGKFNNNQGNMSACQINATTKLTVPAVSGMTVTIPAEFSTSYLGEESNTGTVASGSTTWTYTGDASTVTLTINESNKYPKSMTIVYPAVASTTISLNSNGYATYSASYDFEVSGAKAYTATLDFDSETITCTEITDGKVPAGTGVLLFGDGGAEMTITPTTGVAALTNNDLKATTLANGSVATMGSNTYYVLNGDTFGKYTGSAFAANKAYFEVEAGSPARAFNIVFNDETTGISTINRSSLTADDYYNLNGQRISQPAKGLYIVNGKKIVVK
ncbi:MAG: hypothetical protein IJT98_10330, partial [Prevotella sp.]|nr:hypothetical protein [Prevotella sp.]